MTDQTCTLCGRRLNVGSDELSGDCGGDCWGCIGEVEADGGYKPSIVMVMEEWRRGLRPNWTPPTLPETITMWAPIDAVEFEQFAALNWCSFPERVQDLLLFLNKSFAEQMARDWNASRGGGWVVQFELDRTFCWARGIDTDDAHEHREYRFLASDVTDLNRAVVGQITTVAKFR